LPQSPRLLRRRAQYPMSVEKTDQVRWFAEEVLPHERDLRAYLSRTTHSVDVDDVVQESFLRVLRAQETGRIANARAYLFRTARNAVYAVFRRPQIFSPASVTDSDTSRIVEEGLDVAERVSTSEEIAMLLDAIESLPARCREVFILRKLQGVSQKEIAQRLGISECTVQVQVARGARKCTEFFRRRGLTPKAPDLDEVA
jgi:RNA polymerase sigma factor (sigma-70 family)